MRKRVVIAVTLVAVVCLAAGAVAAARGSNGSGAVGRTDVRAVPSLNIGSAKAAAVVDAGGGFIRQKGFARVTHPSTGQYCLKLRDLTLNSATLVAQVTVEWGNSSGNDLMANWYQGGAECPGSGRWLEILTFDESAGLVFSDSVAFAVTVP